MINKDRAYNYGIAGLLALAALIGLWSLYEAATLNPPISLPAVPAVPTPDPAPTPPQGAAPAAQQVVRLPDRNTDSHPDANARTITTPLISIQWATSGDTWFVDFTIGPALGAAFSRYSVTTTNATGYWGR
jgi:hypothetical protein